MSVHHSPGPQPHTQTFRNDMALAAQVSPIAVAFSSMRVLRPSVGWGWLEVRWMICFLVIGMYLSLDWIIIPLSYVISMHPSHHVYHLCIDASTYQQSSLSTSKNKGRPCYQESLKCKNTSTRIDGVQEEALISKTLHLMWWLLLK